ncbi:hypothetical protein [Vagococcus salmoninarum]|uniref:hypothetical protein n=1 Tax=Vagococcus salmoninarum TaxID=2739 RepID=UPI003F97E27D
MLKCFIHDYHLRKEEQFLNQQLAKGYLFQKSVWCFYFFNKTKNKNRHLYIDLVESHVPPEINQFLYLKKANQDILKLYLDSPKQSDTTRIDAALQTKCLDSYRAQNRRNRLLLLSFLITFCPLVLVFNLPPLLIAISLGLLTLCLTLLSLEQTKAQKLKKMPANQRPFPLRHLIFFTEPNYSPLEDHLSFLGTWKILLTHDTYTEYELLTTLSESELTGELASIPLEPHQKIRILPPRMTLAIRASILEDLINQ